MATRSGSDEKRPPARLAAVCARAKIAQMASPADSRRGARSQHDKNKHDKNTDADADADVPVQAGGQAPPDSEPRTPAAYAKWYAGVPPDVRRAIAVKWGELMGAAALRGDAATMAALHAESTIRMHVDIGAAGVAQLNAAAAGILPSANRTGAPSPSAPR